MYLAEGLRRQVEEGVSRLRRGGVIAYPTDTVYGLGALPDIPQAVERVYRIKGRPQGMALPLLLSDVSRIGDVAAVVPDVAWLLARAFLPGGLTLVLLKANSVPDIVTGGGRTVAVRVPAHPVPVALIEGVGKPVVGTSANLSGKPSALTAEEVRAQLGGNVDFIIDGGRAPGGVESTVVDCTMEPPTVLREGAISLERLRQVVPQILIKGG